MADDEFLLSSQILDSHSHIFYDTSGSHLEIFVDPGAVPGRPKLVRNLRKAGAHICIAVAQAQLILVDSSTKPGRQFIRDWGQDQRKVVLEYGWARMCIDAGKALLADDNWGGCRAVDDGFDSDEEEDEVLTEILRKPPKPKGPLPTPRPTPIETTRSSQVRNRSASPRPSSGGDRLDSSPQSLQPQPSPGNDLFNRYPQANVPAQVQQFPHPPPPHVSPGLSFPQQLTYGGLTSLQQPFMNPTLPGQIDPQTVMSMMDVIRHQGMNPQAFFSQMFMNASQPPFIQSGMFPPMFSSQLQSNGLLHSAQGQQSPDALAMESTMTRDSLNTQQSSSSKSQILSHSDNRRSTTPSALPLSRSRTKLGKSPSTPSHRKSSPSTIGTPKSSFESQPLSDDVPKLSKPCILGSPRPPGRIFVSKSNKPLSFFVQVDLSNRLSVVNKIKKNGGRIESDNILADYVILDSAKEKDFASLLGSTAAANKVALRAGFVHDCFEQGALLDTIGYIFEEPASQKRKRGPSAATTPSAKEKAIRRRERHETPTKKRTEQKPKNDDLTRRSRSPTPPGSDARQLSRGRYLFSDEERAYFRRYARIIFERDPLVSNYAIAQKMHKKMPTHSTASWRQYMNKAQDLDDLRREFTRAHRDTQNEVESVNGQENNAGPSKRAKYSSIPVEDPQKGVKAVQPDFDIICNFFAFGDTHGNDDEVWAELTRQALCQSAPDWPTFYSNNLTEVNGEIERLIQTISPSSEFQPSKT